MAAAIRLSPRYARLCTNPEVPEAEANYHYAHLDWELPLSSCALVCIDCWNWHFSADTLARIDAITRDRIAPLLAACRAGGMQVIHAPASPVADRHPNLTTFPDVEPETVGPTTQPSWPPAQFRTKTGSFAGFARPAEPQLALRNAHREASRAFHDSARPVGDEAVIRTGNDLHVLCGQRKILHLFFVGFNTNACVMMRDYGLPTMVRRGYHGILVRDCTTGMEIADTVADLVCTRGTIATIEQFLGYTVESAELIHALTGGRQ